MGNNNYSLLHDPEMTEIVESFQVETKEILEKLDTDLLLLEKQPNDLELLNQIFRSFHTIKGTSGFLGLQKLTAVTHKCEDILNKLRKSEIQLTADLMDGILTGYDTIKNLFESIEKNKNEDIDIEETLQLLKLLIDGKNNCDNADGSSNKISEKPEQVISDNTLSQKEGELSVKKTDNTIRVDVERLDELLNIVSELVLGRNRLQQLTTEYTIENEGTVFSRELAAAAKQIDLMTDELQQVVMKTRMIKIGKVFKRFPRLVRDLSKETGKKISLIINGEDTELDKTLIEEINDPLVHLIRNSIDHGIESPEIREAAGKDSVGKIVLSAEQEGNNILITIEDDGKGIDPEIIKEKAVSKGVITIEKAKELTKQEIYNLIFLPGFSTAETVSNISGRGVGMDVVKTNVSRLRGIINIESTPGKGTKINIKLPLTLAIIPGMIFKVSGEHFVIPLNSVIEVLRVHSDEITTINQKEVIRMRESIIPLVSLEHLFVNSCYKHNESKFQYVIVIGLAERKFGIKVDSLIGQKEIVIKSLGSYLGNINGIAGSTIMGDGTVVMILDVNELINNAETEPTKA